MRRILKWTLRLAALLAVVAIAVGLWKRDEITRLIAVNTLFDEGKITRNFSNMGAAFLSAPIPRGPGPVSALPQGPAATLPPDVAQWAEARALTSLLVLHKGQIVFEEYYRGTTPDDRRISWSIAKSYLSALFGAVLADGQIDSLDDPVTKYAPTLKGSAYDGASIRDVLQMSSGVLFDEDYLDYNSDINRMGRILALGGSMDAFASDWQARFQPPGTGWKYVSIDTHVLGMVIRGATGRGLPELLAEKIIAPLGMEQDAYYLTDGDGVAFALGGLNLTTRDFARFGLMFEQEGRYGDTQVLPPEWVAESTAPSAKTAPGKIRYGYQWWIPHGADPGVFLGRGIYSQYLYIDQQRDVVIVATAADRKFREPGVTDESNAMLARIAETVAGE